MYQDRMLTRRRLLSVGGVTVGAALALSGCGSDGGLGISVKLPPEVSAIATKLEAIAKAFEGKLSTLGLTPDNLATAASWVGSLTSIVGKVRSGVATIAPLVQEAGGIVDRVLSLIPGGGGTLGGAARTVLAWVEDLAGIARPAARMAARMPLGQAEAILEAAAAGR